MKKIIYILTLLIAWPAFARQYNVEVIVFKRNIEPTTYTQEAWPDILAPKNLDRAISYNDRATLKRNGAYLLSPSYYRLSGLYKKLEDSGLYEPLLHMAWQQSGYSESRAPTIHIETGQNFSSDFVTDGRTIDDAEEGVILKSQYEAEEAGLIPPLSNDSTISSTPVYELDGTMKVYVRHFLYMDTTLDLKIPGESEILVDTSDNGNEQESESEFVIGNYTLHDNELPESIESNDDPEITEFLKTYRMNENRKMKSEEIHYIDHPLMGMIVLVKKA